MRTTVRGIIVNLKISANPKRNLNANPTRSIAIRENYLSPKAMSYVSKSEGDGLGKFEVSE